jgi:hypothetical protein
MKNLGNGWNLVEIVIVWIISFIGVQVFSFLTWGLFLQIEREGTPADGLGFFFILFVVNPVWLILAISLPIITRYKLKGEYADLKRVLVCAFVPVFVAALVSGVMTITLFN